MGYLNKDGFNQVLAVLENLKFKRLRDTPLADRLFKLLDKVYLELQSKTQAKYQRKTSVKRLIKL